MLRVLVFMVLIDANFTPKKQKKKKLSQIARAFGISKDELDSFIQSFGNLKGSQKNLSLEEAYKILELNQNADLNLVKK